MHFMASVLLDHHAHFSHKNDILENFLSKVVGIFHIVFGWRKLLILRLLLHRNYVDNFLWLFMNITLMLARKVPKRVMQRLQKKFGIFYEWALVIKYLLHIFFYASNKSTKYSINISFLRHQLHVCVMNSSRGKVR